MHLVVTEPFGDHAKGDRITDSAEVEAVRASHPGHVIGVPERPLESDGDDPAAAPKSPKAAKGAKAPKAAPAPAPAAPAAPAAPDEAAGAD